MSQNPREDFEFEGRTPKSRKCRKLISQMTPAKRYMLVAGIALCLLIPLWFVRGLVSDRMTLYHAAVESIGDSWGRSQLIQGPLLIVPVELHEREKIKRADGVIEWAATRVISRFVVVLPNQFTAKVELLPEERVRSIYRHTVYTSRIVLNGSFMLPDIYKSVNKWNGVRWERAFLAFGVADPRGLEDIRCTASFAGPGIISEEIVLSAEPGTGLSWLESGFRVPLPLAPGRAELSLALSMRLNGSGGIRIAPIGENSLIDMRSSWPHPSFQGEKLPTEREVTSTGFTARWKIPHLARSYPQCFLSEEHSSGMRYEHQMGRFTVGADLFEPITYYSQVERATKYGILFICLTFVGIIAFEASIAARMHPLQYGLVGLAMTVFYLILLSLAEHMGFLAAYAIACVAAILMISLYVAAALRNALRACGVAVLLAALYILLYALLQLEDYALLVGTGLVVCMLGVLMYVTRNLGYKS